jgi:aspartokinase
MVQKFGGTSLVSVAQRERAVECVGKARARDDGLGNPRSPGSSEAG